MFYLLIDVALSRLLFQEFFIMYYTRNGYCVNLFSRLIYLGFHGIDLSVQNEMYSITILELCNINIIFLLCALPQ